ncbi:hypothetical protein, variant 1 [Allomyces macrogynus ATCC 38327]|uniref:Uncharacterized protein n=1 Tax=Allomyces macrogynus (strain ATCC 38327) TaxID=578462 RepID=A0A0L0SYD6_ALLM3|nr:hypothetical protein, variant 1 [Allomyces macrogynus ATCC 38327]|eukprot:KNE67420.1 hypothetical protein, variant 1 [Allomyces macrogynus ATCC 38327]
MRAASASRAISTARASLLGSTSASRGQRPTRTKRPAAAPPPPGVVLIVSDATSTTTTTTLSSASNAPVQLPALHASRRPTRRHTVTSMFAFTAPGRRRNHTGDASEDAALGFTCKLRIATVTRNLASSRWAEHAVPTPPETTTPDTETPTRDRTGTMSSTMFDDAVSTFSVASAATTARASSHARDTPPRHRFPIVPPPLPPNHADPPPPPPRDNDPDDNAIPVRVAVILDGHGSRPEDGTSVGPGARVVAHLAWHLPRIVRQLVHLDPGLLAEIPCLAAQIVEVAAELDADLALTPAPSLSSTTTSDEIPPWYLPLLTHALAHLKDLLNRFLDATFLVAAWDAGRRALCDPPPWP